MTAGELRQRLLELLADSGLVIQERPFELIIINPRDEERGQIHVAFEDGLVSWERVIWHYWGPLQGCEDPARDDGPAVTAARIIQALAGPPETFSAAAPGG